MPASFIRVIDLETDGEPGIDGQVLEVGWCDLVLRGGIMQGDPQWTVGELRAQLVDPVRPIGAESSAIHHLIDEDFKGRPIMPAWAILSAVCNPAKGAPLAFAAHSAKHEQAWLPGVTLPWLCTYKIGMRLWPLAPSHSNQALRYHLWPAGLDRALAAPAHRAGPDAYVTAHILREALDLAPFDDLLKWSSGPALQTICRLGDWRGKRWSEVDDGFLDWCARKITNDEDIAFTVRTEIEKRKQASEARAIEQRKEVVDDDPDAWRKQCEQTTSS